MSQIPSIPAKRRRERQENWQRITRKFGNWEHAVLAYNAGADRIDDYLAGRGKPLKQETVDYLPKVLDAFQHVDRGA